MHMDPLEPIEESQPAPEWEGQRRVPGTDGGEAGGGQDITLQPGTAEGSKAQGGTGQGSEVHRLFLRSLEMRCFRNLEPAQLRFRERLTLIVGENAQGKTNLLEAIHLAITGSAFRSVRNIELVRFGEREAQVQGTLVLHEGERDFRVQVSQGQRRIWVDGKAVRGLEGFSRLVKVVLFTPDDLSLVRGAPSQRRDYLDQAITHLFPRFREISRDYQKVLSSRNRLLQEGAVPELVSVWDERLIELGSKIGVARARFVNRIRGRFQEQFARVSGTGLKVGLRYCPDPPELLGTEQEDVRKAFAGALEQRAVEERRRGVTLCGPHRDELEVTLEGREAAVYASQGQTRMLALSFKLVELYTLLEDQRLVPMFLLDDVSSELDEVRNRFLMNALAEAGCQVFVTTTSQRHVPVEGFGGVQVLRVCGGSVEGE